MAIIACMKWEPQSTSWVITNDLNGGLDIAVSWLSSEFDRNQWEHAPWDTAVALRALSLSHARRDCFERARRWLHDLAPESIYPRVGVHHVAQRLLTLAELAANQSLITPSRQFLIAFLASQNWRSLSPYIVGQCAWALSATGRLDDDVRLQLSDHLWGYLANTDVNNANFVDICGSGIGLVSLDTQPKLKVADLIVPRLLGDNCFRTDFSWYREPLKSSWALLLLHNLHKVTMIEAYSSDVFDILRATRAETRSLLVDTRRVFLKDLRNILLHLFGFCGVAALWIYLTFHLTVHGSFPGYINWLCGAIEAYTAAKLGLLINSLLRKNSL